MANQQRRPQQNRPNPQPTKPPQQVSREAGDPSTETPVTDPQTAATQAELSGQPDNADAVGTPDQPETGENAPLADADSTDGVLGDDGVLRPAEGDFEASEPVSHYVGGDGFDPSVVPDGVILDAGEPLAIPVVQTPDGRFRAEKTVYRRIYLNGASRPTFTILVTEGQIVNSTGTVAQYL